MLKPIPFYLFIIQLLLYLIFSAASVAAIEEPIEDTESIGITQNLGEIIDLQLEFSNRHGELVKLQDLIVQNKPIAIVPVYYRCPGLCSLILNGVVELIDQLQLELGKDFRLLTVSFNSEESSELAKKKAANYYAELKKPELGEAGWHFLSGTKENVLPLMQQIGFRFKKDGAEFAHSSVVVIISPEGKISRYFADVRFNEPEFRRALVDAADGRIGNFLDKAFQFCFQFDPTKGKYSLAVLNLSKVVGGATIIFLAAVVFWASRKKRLGA